MYQSEAPPHKNLPIMYDLPSENPIVKTKQWLDEFSPEFGIDKAYIFDSVTRVSKFRQHSDVDVAVENIHPEQYCLAISLLSTYLERDVDIIRLNDCHFSDRIRQTGILWKKTP